MMSQPHLELRLVLLGAHDSGKTYVINTLLGQVESEPESKRGTANCLKREGEVSGRKVIFTDTPGWWRNYPLSDTANFIKQELVLSVTKCPPGPHAFLLVIDSDAPFTDKNRKSLEEHVGLFGQNVWEHTIVVFTRGESLEGKSIEQHIESEGEALKWLVEKCGNRCHMLCIGSAEGENMVTQLLDKIDNVVAQNGNSHFEVNDKLLAEIVGKMKMHQEKAKLRQQKALDKREMLHTYGITPLPEIRILLLGWLISGKTSASRTILGHPDNRVKQSRTRQSQRMSKEVCERQVSVVDTPGWWKYFPAKYTPDWVKMELQKGLTLNFRPPHVVLLAVPADTAFLEEQKKITEDNMKMFGEQVWRHTMVLFTCGDRLGDISIEEHIETEGEALQWLIEKCGNRYHVMSWDDDVDKVKELLGKIDEMVADNSFFRPESKTHRSEEEEATEESEEQRKLAHFLDQEWESMDRASEERIMNMRSIIHSKKTKSMDNDFDFRGNVSSSEDTSEDINSGKGTSPLSPPEAQSSMKESAAIHANPDQEQTSKTHTSLIEILTEMLEKEFARRELRTTQRFQSLLAQQRESEMSSEPDLHDVEHAVRKVNRWKAELTSGYGSTPDEEELDAV